MCSEEKAMRQEETSVSPWVWSWNIQTNRPQIHHSLNEPNACVGWQHRAWPCLFHCSVAQSCPTLCNPRDCGTPGFPVLHYLLEFAQTHVHWVGDAIQPSHPLSSLLLLPSIFPASGSFAMSQLFTSGGQSIGTSTSASVLPMNVQGWFPLGWTGLIFLRSKKLSRVFSSTTVWKQCRVCRSKTTDADWLTTFLLVELHSVFSVN